MCSIPDCSPIWNDSVAFSHWILLLILLFKQRMPCKQLLRLHVPCWTNSVSTGPCMFGPQFYPQVLMQGRAQSNSSRGRRKFIVIYFMLVLMYYKYKVYKTIIILLICTNNRVLNLCWPYCEHFRCASPFHILIMCILQMRKQAQRGQGHTVNEWQTGIWTQAAGHTN